MLTPKESYQFAFLALVLFGVSVWLMAGKAFPYIGPLPFGLLVGVGAGCCFVGILGFYLTL